MLGLASGEVLDCGDTRCGGKCSDIGSDDVSSRHGEIREGYRIVGVPLVPSYPPKKMGEIGRRCMVNVFYHSRRLQYR